MTVFLVGIFGAVGCVVRYFFEYTVRRFHPRDRPWATVGANAVGCAIAGFVVYRFAGATDLHLRDVVVTGFCGGLTTFSSAFAIPALLQREHHWRFAATLVVATPIVCLGFFLLGVHLAA